MGSFQPERCLSGVVCDCVCGVVGGGGSAFLKKKLGSTGFCRTAVAVSHKHMQHEQLATILCEAVLIWYWCRISVKYQPEKQKFRFYQTSAKNSHPSTSIESSLIWPRASASRWLLQTNILCLSFLTLHTAKYSRYTCCYNIKSDITVLVKPRSFASSRVIGPQPCKTTHTQKKNYQINEFLGFASERVLH